MASVDGSGTARGWIRADESGGELLGRMRTERPSVLLPPLHRLPLRVSNVVEIVGPSPSAKSNILIQAAITCILPKELNGIHYGGLDRLVLYIDLDCRFDILRLAQSLKHRMVAAKRGNSNKTVQSNEGDFWNFKTEEEPVDYNEELFAMCMRRFLYIRCYECFEFLAALKTLHYQCQKEREVHGVGAYFLMIDSIGAFHWVDRVSSSQSTGNNSRKRLSLQSIFETVVLEIQNLLHVHPMIIFATKATILGDQYSLNEVNRTHKNWFSHDAPDSSTAASSHHKVSYREHMPPVWQSFVTHRILVKASEDKFNNYARQKCSLHTLEWLLPPLSLSDKFIVRDAGIFPV